MGVGTVELKWAINEGYTYLPDIAVRAHISKLFNARNFDLIAGGVDLGVGKRFAIAGTLTLTPYVGWNLVFVGASIGQRGLQPASDAGRVRRCRRSVLRPLPLRPLLAAKDNAHNRFYVGFQVVGGIFQMGGEVSYSVLGKAPGQQTDGSVMAYNVTMGLQF